MIFKNFNLKSNFKDPSCDTNLLFLFLSIRAKQ